MTLLVRGQKVELTKADPALETVKIGLGWDAGNKGEVYDLDAVALLINESGQLARKENLVFYNNLSGGNASVRLTKDNRTGAGEGDDEQISIDLKNVPPGIKKIAIAITIHEAGAKNQDFSQISNAYAHIQNERTGKELCRYELDKEFLKDSAIIIGEVYLHNGGWKFSALGQSINGGLSALCQHYKLKADESFFTKTAADIETKKAEPARPAVNLAKVELKKSGDKINLNKTNAPLGEILVNLNWNQKSKKGLFGSILKGNQSVDLDLGCLFELTDGRKGVVQALGNSFGELKNAPYISLDQDDRTGAAVGGENLRINGNQLSNFKRILVFAFIYQGAANWAEVDGVVTLKQQNGPDIEVRLDEHRAGKGMCAIALLENISNETLSVKKTVQYFNGHKEMDGAFKWGMRWSAGSK